ncbi:MAG: CAP domain-containing protein [Actinomycetota bacterium]
MRTTRSVGATRIVLVSTLVLALGLGVLGTAPASAGKHGRRDQMLSLLNKARTNREVRRLDVKSIVARRAAGHSRAMDRKNRLYHSDPLARQVRGLRWRVVGENVGVGPSIDGLYRAFMRSKPHKRNILDRSFKKVGIGFDVDRRGNHWVTLIFYG